MVKRNLLAALVRTGTSDAAEVERLYESLVGAGSVLERGKWLVRLREILERSGTFGKFLQAQKLVSLRTAYRYMNGYEAAVALLPEVVVQEAMKMDLPLYGDSEDPLGRYSATLKNLPAPRNPSRKQAREYLDAVEAATPRRVFMPRSGEPDSVLEECYRVVARRMRWVRPADRAVCVSRLIGMIMTEFGLARGTFSGIEIPEHFKARVAEPMENAAKGQRARRERTQVA
jgi:hypothetical protein